MSKIKRVSTPIKIIVFLLFVLVLFTGICLIEISESPESASLFADNVLRPLIGEKPVIAIEGFVFGIQDKINKIQNSAPASSYFTSNINEVPLNSTGQPASAEIIPPTDIKPVVDASNPLPGEGEWKTIASSGLYTTFIRTDPARPFAVVNLVDIPLNNISIGAVAGTKHPGGELKKFGTGIVPLSIQESDKLIAAFNGGFQEKDGHYGMYADGVTYVPMKNGLATIFIYKDGHVSIQSFNPSELSGDVLAVRQNGPMLIENGVVSKNTSEGTKLWAGTSAGDYVTWRSGLGVTPNGYLIYAVGPSLTPQSLGDALRLAGCTQAMQLDINNYWVRFMLYTWNTNTNSYSSLPLTKSLPNVGKQFLTGSDKDFFYIYKR
jgi:hypothetical protein